MTFLRVLEVRLRRRGLEEITSQIAEVVAESGVEQGVCNLFVQHTSASLCINENADPTAREDLEAFLDHLVPENTPFFRHTYEGADDMPSHIKNVLTNVSLNVPVAGGRLALGTWQGIYFWEHRDRPPRRKVVVTVW